MITFSKGNLFSGTIRSNLKYGAPEATDEELEEVIRVAQAKEFIDQKEERFDMEISQGGTNVSGGQKQRLGIARALLSNPEILILDEHTAALDPKTAELIMELTGKVVKEKKLTTIMVTHNLRYAVEYGNRILMMHQGHAVLDKAGEEKAKLVVDDLLDQFNQISIECGN